MACGTDTVIATMKIRHVFCNAASIDYVRCTNIFNRDIHYSVRTVYG